VVDDFTRECLALALDTSLSGRRVVRELDRIVQLRGAPLLVVSEPHLVFRRLFGLSYAAKGMVSRLA